MPLDLGGASETHHSGDEGCNQHTLKEQPLNTAVGLQKPDRRVQNAANSVAVPGGDSTRIASMPLLHAEEHCAALI